MAKLFKKLINVLTNDDWMMNALAFIGFGLMAIWGITFSIYLIVISL